MCNKELWLQINSGLQKFLLPDFETNSSNNRNNSHFTSLTSQSNSWQKSLLGDYRKFLPKIMFFHWRKLFFWRFNSNNILKTMCIRDDDDKYLLKSVFQQFYKNWLHFWKWKGVVQWTLKESEMFPLVLNAVVQVHMNIKLEFSEIPLWL